MIWWGVIIGKEGNEIMIIMFFILWLFLEYGIGVKLGIKGRKRR